MLRYLGLVSLVALIGVTSPGLTSIAGTFDCVTRDNTGTVWRFHSVNRHWGSWVRADTTFAPQNGQTADTASTYVGFDASAKQWNIVSLDTGGSYYTRYSKSTAFHGSNWKDGYPSDGATAVIRVSSTGYTFDYTGAPKSGRSDRSLTTCSRT
jgi:hypothetical protein